MKRLVLSFIITLFLFSISIAQETSSSKVDTGDTAFILLCSALVLLMTPGLAFFYGGLVRGKNVINTMMMSFIALGVIGIQWVLWGYSLAFSPGNQIIGSLDWFGLKNVGLEPNRDYSTTIPHQTFMIFQAMFAIITPALISGAIVERIKFKAYIIFVLLWATFVYDFVAHWVWGIDGWLRKLGALDFAGGTVVHINAGVSALIIALLLGARRGFPNKPMTPHNVPFSILGASLLWFGWFGFNAGSAIASGSLATTAFVATNTATAAGVLAWCIIESLFKGKATAVGAITGAVAGLVAITPACGFVNIFGAIAIGAGAAIVCYLAIMLRLKLKFDDSLDAFSVHGIGGIWGSIATGIFATKEINPLGNNGLLYGNPELLTVQLIGVSATIAISAIGTFLIIAVLNFVMSIRVDEVTEEEGLDLVQHGERAYHFEGIGETVMSGFSATLKSEIEQQIKPQKKIKSVEMEEPKRRMFGSRRPPVVRQMPQREPPKRHPESTFEDKSFVVKIEKIDKKLLEKWWRDICTKDWRVAPDEFKEIYPNVKMFSDSELFFNRGNPNETINKIETLLQNYGFEEFEIKIRNSQETS
jgi:Amt family ammonium transporter